MIIISALDNSGQLYAADLVRELKSRMPEQTFVGIGGADLADAGCELVHDISDSSAMLTGIFGAMKWAIPAFRKLKKLMKTEQVDLVILLDSPTFNLPLAKAARKRGIKTLYYIAPQIWAWAEFRHRRIRKRVNELAVILPFEQEYFRKFGISAHFVGHPFINRIQKACGDDELSEALSKLNVPEVLLMPGSRGHVVHELLPSQLRIMREVKSEVGPTALCIAAWGGVVDAIEKIAIENDFKINHASANNIIADGKTVNIFTDSKERQSLIEKAGLVLAASGTGTLEVAWHGRPMLIMYNTSKWFWHLLARWLIRTKFLSLVNILAAKELVPEYMPYIKDESAIAKKAVMLLTEKEKALRLGWDAQALVQGLHHDDPSKQVADLAMGLMSKE